MVHGQHDIIVQRLLIRSHRVHRHHSNFSLLRLPNIVCDRREKVKSKLCIVAICVYVSVSMSFSSFSFVCWLFWVVFFRFCFLQTTQNTFAAIEEILQNLYAFSFFCSFFSCETSFLTLLPSVLGYSIGALVLALAFCSISERITMVL